MKLNTRFAVAVHLLALLTLNQKTLNTSELMARSVNTNSVVIRRLTSQLKKAGLVQVRPGVGGASLTRAADEITLLDVYRAVNTKQQAPLLPLHPDPNQRCPIGRNIHDALEMPLAKANQAMLKSLETTSVADIAAFIQMRKGG